MSEETKRAVVEYKVTPFGEKPKTTTFQRVIEGASTPTDVEKIFWYRPIWPRGTRKIEIVSITWPDAEEQA